MNNKTSLIFANPAKLSSFIQDCTQSDGIQEGVSEMQELLRSALEQKFEISSPKDNSRSVIYNNLLAEAQNIHETKSVLDILLSTESQVSELNNIKQDIKKKRKELHNKKLQDVAVVIYYAAIASSIAFHNGTKISSFGYDEIKESLEKLCQNDWIVPEIHDLFNKAIIKCNNMIDEKENG